MADESSMRAVGWARSLPLSAGVKEARDWTRAHMAALGWERTAPTLVDSVVLAVSELVTNAHVHAHSAAQLILTWDEHCLHVTVHDASPRLPEQRHADHGALGGAGCSWSTPSPTTGRSVAVPAARTSPCAFNHPSPRREHKGDEYGTRSTG